MQPISVKNTAINVMYFIAEFFIIMNIKKPAFKPDAFSKGDPRSEAGKTSYYFKNCMYGSLLASSCTLSALAMRAERACQEPSRN